MLRAHTFPREEGTDMAEYTVYFITDASSPVTVDLDIDPDMDRDEARQKIEDAAWEELNAHLCHACARHLDLGDFTPADAITGFDEDA